MRGLSEKKTLNRLDHRNSRWVSCGPSYLLPSLGISMRTASWISCLFVSSQCAGSRHTPNPLKFMDPETFGLKSQSDRTEESNIIQMILKLFNGFISTGYTIYRRLNWEDHPWTWRDVVVAYLKLLSWYSLEGTEENHDMCIHRQQCVQDSNQAPPVHK
jgi:hypothetical protein